MQRELKKLFKAVLNINDFNMKVILNWVQIIKKKAKINILSEFLNLVEIKINWVAYFDINIWKIKALNLL